jgi:hypothetical protein
MSANPVILSPPTQPDLADFINRNSRLPRLGDVLPR